MTYKSNLDITSNSEVIVKLFSKIENIKELKEQIVSGSLQCCLIKPSLICDPFQIVVSANKAILSEKLTTRTLYSEILYNLSISKNISQSLQKFGVDEKDDAILAVVVVRAEDVGTENETFRKIAGEELDILRLTDFCDVSLMKKEYKINDEELEKCLLIDAIVSRIAVKDFIN